MYRRSYGHATKLEDIRRDAETTTDVNGRPRALVVRSQLELVVGTVNASPCIALHRGATLCGGRVARCRNFSLQFDLTMTAVDILGITAEI